MDEQLETIQQNAEHAGEIESKAKEKFEAQTLAWTGNVWDWNAASEEVKERFRIHARSNTRPPLPAEI